MQQEKVVAILVLVDRVVQFEKGILSSYEPRVAILVLVDRVVQYIRFKNIGFKVLMSQSLF